MAFTLTRASTASPQRLWSVVSDVATHGRFFPGTTMTTDPGPPRVGWSFTAFSGAGRVGFTDNMVLTEWEPPTRLRMAKLGPVLLGWAEVSVAPAGAGSLLTWSESALPRGLPRRLARVGDALGSSFYDRVLGAIVSEAEREQR